MRLLLFGGRGGGSAHREKLFGRYDETCGMYRWLRESLSWNDSKGTGERCTLAHVDGKKRCFMHVTRSSCWRRSSALTEPPVTGTLALQDVRRRSQSNEEDR